MGDAGVPRFSDMKIARQRDDSAYFNEPAGEMGYPGVAMTAIVESMVVEAACSGLFRPGITLLGRAGENVRKVDVSKIFGWITGQGRCVNQCSKRRDLPWRRREEKRHAAVEVVVADGV